MYRKFPSDTYFHVFNRGVDKRDIFIDKGDLMRFRESLFDLNRRDPVGGLYVSRLQKQEVNKEPMVEIICYCLCPNHFHLLVRSREDGAISEFMRRLLLGYTLYFNNRNKRSGSLFQGRFKSRQIETNNQLLVTYAYIILNGKIIHKYDPSALFLSSTEEGRLPKENRSIDDSFIKGQFTKAGQLDKYVNNTARYIRELREKNFD